MMKNQKIMMTGCTKKEPPHPCDPKEKCDICDLGDPCPKPSLCMDRIKNPQENYETRCKPGAFLPTSKCKQSAKDPPHPCDDLPACIPGVPDVEPCPNPSLCREKVKNLEDKDFRCPDPDDRFSRKLCENLALLRTPIKTCPKKPCAPPELTDPFLEPETKNLEVAKKCVDPNEYLYSRLLCKHLDMLKKTIKSCMHKPCSPPELTDPFTAIDPEDQYPEKKDPCVEERDELRKKKKNKC